MTEIYANLTYPQSRRMSSRPFSSFHRRWDLPATVDDLRNTMNELGKGLLRGFARKNSNLEGAPPRSFDPHFNVEEDFMKIPEDVIDEYCEHLSVDAKMAFCRIRSQVERGIKIAEEAKKNREPYNKGYELDVLIADFKTLWNEDILVDTRLSNAEETFMEFAALNNYQDNPFYYPDDDMKKHFEWMADPENGQRVAFTFLYSRIAQHFGEQNHKSFDFAKHIMEEIENGHSDFVLADLLSNPVAYYEEVTGSALPQEDTGFLGNLFGKATEKWKELQGLNAPEDHAQRKAMTALSFSAETIIIDYHRLADGSWANEFAKESKPEVGTAPKVS